MKSCETQINKNYQCVSLKVWQDVFVWNLAMIEVRPMEKSCAVHYQSIYLCTRVVLNWIVYSWDQTLLIFYFQASEIDEEGGVGPGTETAFICLKLFKTLAGIHSWNCASLFLTLYLQNSFDPIEKCP